MAKSKNSLIATNSAKSDNFSKDSIESKSANLDSIKKDSIEKSSKSAKQGKIQIKPKKTYKTALIADSIESKKADLIESKSANLDSIKKDSIESKSPKSAKITEQKSIKAQSAKPSNSRVLSSLAAFVLSAFLPRPLALGLGLLSCAPLFASGAKQTLQKGITSHSLEALAVGISLNSGDVFGACGTNFLLDLGEYIEELTEYKSDDLIRELSKPQAPFVWVEREISPKTKKKKNAIESSEIESSIESSAKGAKAKNIKTELVQIRSEELKVGDIVVVGAGEHILVDGRVVAGEASVNEISMTGEAEPVAKKYGDKVISGTTISDGQIKIWSESVGVNTATARIKNYILSTLQQKSNREAQAHKIADKLVPFVLALAGGSSILSRDFNRAASVLQADYSCALKLTTPVALKAAISSAANAGIILKGARALEELCECDTFVFDKTGTLTKGELEVLSVHSLCEEWSEEDVLNLAASIEEHYFHPIAKAIVKAAKERNFRHFHHDDATFIVAHGVKTQVNNKPVIIGSKHFLEIEKVDFSSANAKIENFLQNGATPLFIGYDGILLGVILLKDEVRENAKQTLQKLRKNGVKKIIMLSGDQKTRAEKIAKELGIERVYSELLPTQKAEILEQIIKENKGKVAFVGDGINDAPALITANCGIGMHRGADIAKASADIVLLRDDIAAVAEARELANLCMQKIKRNFKITIGANSAILALAALGKLSPIQSAFLHNGTTIALLINALQKTKLKTQRAKKEQK